MIEESFKLILILLLSSLIGIEREIRQKGAGLRTHILVGCGSTLIIMAGFFTINQYETHTSIDPTRIIHAVIMSIGFICAGTIIRQHSDQVQGLTTAATLWIVAGLGICVGVGYYSAAILMTILVLFILIMVRRFEVLLWSKFHKKSS